MDRYGMISKTKVMFGDTYADSISCKARTKPKISAYMQDRIGLRSPQLIAARQMRPLAEDMFKLYDPTCSNVRFRPDRAQQQAEMIRAIHLI